MAEFCPEWFMMDGGWVLSRVARDGRWCFYCRWAVEIVLLPSVSSPPAPHIVQPVLFFTPNKTPWIPRTTHWLFLRVASERHHQLTTPTEDGQANTRYCTLWKRWPRASLPDRSICVLSSFSPSSFFSFSMWHRERVRFSFVSLTTTPVFWPDTCVCDNLVKRVVDSRRLVPFFEQYCTVGAGFFSVLLIPNRPFFCDESRVVVSWGYFSFFLQVDYTDLWLKTKAHVICGRICVHGFSVFLKKHHVFSQLHL